MAPKNGTKYDWKNVKIEGPTTSDDINFEGLMGVEILEDYDRSLFKRGKKKAGQIFEMQDDFEDSDNETTSKKKSKKQKVDKKLKTEYLLADESGSESDESEMDVEDYLKTKKEAAIQKKRAEEEAHGKASKRKAQDDGKAKKKKKKKAKKGKTPVPEGDEDSCGGQFVKLVKSDVVETSNEPCEWPQLGVAEPIVRALESKGFRTPTEIQRLTLPSAIFGRRDILGAAETGSGKTLAFGIPVVNGILSLMNQTSEERSAMQKAVATEQSEQPLTQFDRDLTPPPEELAFRPANGDFDEQSDSDYDEFDLLGLDTKLKKKKSKLAETPAPVEVDSRDKPLYALILTPTRELAVQIHAHIKDIVKFTNLKVATIFGGLATVKQERVLKQCPEIVIATPGRLWELIEQNNGHLSKIDDLKFLVIDETDRMLEKGHFEEVGKLMERINVSPAKKALRQNFVFSATLTMVHDLPHYLQKKKKKRNIMKPTPGQKIQDLVEALGLVDPKVVDITQSSGTAQLLTECRILCKQDEKDFYLYYFLKRHTGRTLVFCNSITAVKRLASVYQYLNCDCGTLHGNMIQKQRLKNLERFTANPNGILIATDVAARGLDIPHVKHVIHYQVPKTTENYVHRSGRTARANNEGIAVLMMEPKEVRDYVRLHQNLGRKEDLPLFPVSDQLMGAVRKRVLLAREIELLDHRSRTVSNREFYDNKSAKEGDFDDKSSNDSDSDYEREKQMKLNQAKRNFRSKQMQLAQMLAKPLFPKGFSFKYPTSEGNIESLGATESPIQLVKDSVAKNKQWKKLHNKKSTRH